VTALYHSDADKDDDKHFDILYDEHVNGKQCIERGVAFDRVMPIVGSESYWMETQLLEGEEYDLRDEDEAEGRDDLVKDDEEEDEVIDSNDGDGKKSKKTKTKTKKKTKTKSKAFKRIIKDILKVSTSVEFERYTCHSLYILHLNKPTTMIHYALQSYERPFFIPPPPSSSSCYYY
jgi:hypothetical protein